MENGKDFRVRLRKGPKFSNGEPVTAHDVRFSWQQHLDRKNASILRSVYRTITDVEIIDDYNLICRLKKKYAPWKELMGMSIGSKKHFDKIGREGWNKDPVGSGPFKLVAWRKGESITMETVKNHHDYQPNFKTLKFLIITDEMTRLAMLETGEVDLTYRILPHMVKRLERNKRIKVKRSDMSPSYNAMDFEPMPYPLMADKNLRLAFHYAINRQEIVDAIFFGEGYPSYMEADQVELGYDPTYKVEFNPEKAKDLVKKSSYKPGTPLTLTYAIGYAPNAPQVAAAIQKYMKDVGVTIRLNQAELGTYLTWARTHQKEIGHMDIFPWDGSLDPIWRLMLGMKSTGIYTNWDNRPDKEIMDKLIDAQATEMDEQKRLAILKEIHKLNNADPDTLPLFGLYMIYAMRDRIDYNWVPKTSEAFHLWNVKVLK